MGTYYQFILPMGAFVGGEICAGYPIIHNDRELSGGGPPFIRSMKKHFDPGIVVYITGCIHIYITTRPHNHTTTRLYNHTTISHRRLLTGFYPMGKVFDQWAK